MLIEILHDFRRFISGLQMYYELLSGMIDGCYDGFVLEVQRLITISRLHIHFSWGRLAEGMGRGVGEGLCPVFKGA